jgi:hypothetical protein
VVAYKVKIGASWAKKLPSILTITRVLARSTKRFFSSFYIIITCIRREERQVKSEFKMEWKKYFFLLDKLGVASRNHIQRYSRVLKYFVTTSKVVKDIIRVLILEAKFCLRQIKDSGFDSRNKCRLFDSRSKALPKANF